MLMMVMVVVMVLIVGLSRGMRNVTMDADECRPSC